MLAINDDYYEDLTAEKMVQLLEALKADVKNLPAQGPMWDEPAKAAIAGSKKSAVPEPGPLSGRKTCENSAGLTSLTSKPWGPEVFRKDL